jgi:hypothetical protein
MRDTKSTNLKKIYLKNISNPKEAFKYFLSFGAFESILDLLLVRNQYDKLAEEDLIQKFASCGNIPFASKQI